MVDCAGEKLGDYQFTTNVAVGLLYVCGGEMSGNLC